MSMVNYYDYEMIADEQRREGIGDPPPRLSKTRHVSDDTVIDVFGAACEANVHNDTIIRAAQRGVLKAEKKGIYWAINRIDLDRWIKDKQAHKKGRRKTC